MLAKLLLVASVAAAVVGVSGASIRATHRGALNARLSDAQLYGPAQKTDLPTQWLTQPLDHEDLASTETFQQRYFTNPQYWTPGGNGPVFFMLGGEGPISQAYLTGHFIIQQLAAQNNALLVTLEHRFYGQSIPGQPANSSTANLRFLSSAQALEDTVTFHEQITSQYNLGPQNKWIIFGGSYSGALSAWARLKYPHLYQGSFSASAPVQAELDFSQYFEVVATSVGTECDGVIAQANAAVSQLLTTPAGIQQLVQQFNLCAAPQTPDDMVTLLGDLSGPIAGVVQYSDDNNSYQPFDVTKMCSILTAAETPLQGLVDVWSQNNAFSNNTQCTDITYAGFIQSMQPTSDGRSWTWQTCTEFGYFQTGAASDQPFSSEISLASFLQQCADIFGVPGLTPNVEWINNFYGGNQIVTSNTVFTDGTVDPWHILGNYQQYSASAQSDAILIDGTAHCADMYPARASDLPGLVAARQKQQQLLAMWLADTNAAPQKIALA